MRPASKRWLLQGLTPCPTARGNGNNDHIGNATAALEMRALETASIEVGFEGQGVGALSYHDHASATTASLPTFYRNGRSVTAARSSSVTTATGQRDREKVPQADGTEPLD